MSREVIEQLTSIRHEAVNPRTEWVARNRAMLLSQIKNTVTEEARLSWHERAWAALSIFLPRTLVYNVVRPVAVLLVIAVAATSAYSGTVRAANETLPGDTLYPAKLFAEKIPITVASLMGDNNAEVKLHLKIAKNRMEETKKILTSDDPRKKDQIGVTMTNLKNELKSVNQKLDDSKDNQNNAIGADAAKDVKQRTEQITSELQDVKLNLLTSNDQDDKDISKKVSETKDLVKEVSVKAVEVMVTKHLEGDQSVSKEDVKLALNTTLQISLNEVVESKQNVDGAKTIVETINTEVKDLKNTKTAAVSAESASTTKEFAEKISDAATATKEASVKTDAASVDADKKAKEVEVLLGNDDILKAFDKVKEVGQVSKEVEKISDATLETTKNVTPIVQVVKTSTGDTSVSTTIFVVSTSKETVPPVIVVSTSVPVIILNSSKVGTSSSVSTTTIK